MKMGKNQDLIIILLIVITGMFIPFLGSIVINYGLDLLKIGSTFGYFLLIFAIELGIVYLYFTISNKIAIKKIEKYKKKNTP
jgi:hypothetical protein